MTLTIRSSERTIGERSVACRTGGEEAWVCFPALLAAVAPATGPGAGPTTPGVANTGLWAPVTGRGERALRRLVRGVFRGRAAEFRLRVRCPVVERLVPAGVGVPWGVVVGWGAGVPVGGVGAGVGAVGFAGSCGGVAAGAALWGLP